MYYINKVEKSSAPYSGVINFLFILIVFVVTRQFPFSFLSPLMNVAVLLIILLSLIRRRFDKYTLYLIFFFFLLPLSCDLIYSVVFTRNKVPLAFKSYVTLMSVGLAYFVHVDRKALRMFVMLCMLQTIVMIGIFVYLSVFFNINTYLPIRQYFILQGWGDVYTYNGIFYKIQIKGSALLVISFILNLETNLFKKKYIVALVLLIGIILAGNFAFMISLAIYLLYRGFTIEGVKSASKYALKLIFFGLIILSISPYIYEYVVATIEMKSDRSLGTRDDQLIVLMDNLFENPLTALIGQGMGHTLDVKTSFRDYTDNTYYEVQLLYIFNQLGIVFFLLFILYNILISLKLWGRNKKIYFIYFIYISYAVTNPYIIDTNHVVIIIVLNSLIIWIRNKNANIDNTKVDVSCAITKN